MPAQKWRARMLALPGSPSAARLQVTAGEWRQAAEDVAAAGGQLLALWTAPAAAPAGRGVVRAALLMGDCLLVLELMAPEADQCYRGLQGIFPCATRMQRAAFDLSGVASDDPDHRPWLRHAAWPSGAYPLIEPPRGLEPAALAADDYAFRRVEGDLSLIHI